jgi:hypothetical protein
LLVLIGIFEFNVFLSKDLIGTTMDNPCRPVLAKNAEPYTESDIVNPASVYSTYWKYVKIIAKINVIVVLIIVYFLLPLIKAW